MFGSIISIDFIQLMEVCDRLNSISCELNNIGYDLKRELYRLSEMSLDVYVEAMKTTVESAFFYAEQVSILSQKLEKIIELYINIETEQLHKVELLPERISDAAKYAGEYILDDINNFTKNVKQNMFAGHFVLNEDWLEKIILDWRYNK